MTGLDICSHLTARCIQRMSYTPLVPNDSNQKLENRIAKQLVGCKSMHLLVFKRILAEVVSREYLCDCPLYFNLDFDQYDQIDTDLVINISDQDDRSLDNEEDEEQKLFEFVDVPFFGSLRTTNRFSPRKGLLKRIYLLNIFSERECRISKGRIYT